MRERDGEEDRMITSAVAMTARSSLHDLGTSIVAAWCEYSKAVAIVVCTCPVLHRVVETYQNGMALRFAWLLLLLLFVILDRKHSFPQGVLVLVLVLVWNREFVTFLWPAKVKGKCSDR